MNARPLFNNSEAFNAFDTYHKSFITQNDFADLLARHRFFATEKELVTLVD
jgi:Ca2+-binding EF-hand superfamily protein